MLAGLFDCWIEELEFRNQGPQDRLSGPRVLSGNVA